MGLYGATTVFLRSISCHETLTKTPQKPLICMSHIDNIKVCILDIVC
ncbi:hypothetical protein SLEP1_g34111 [Rubroshorea leprosula]|uniref:Uncharacterized protein n=1 Tax=Rubroshorea leprosula TaxID=152421 RepID=A0AAV5KIR9_9ROSI|nr:hypothetical protein SLEP1_g34111 [Rubroshorea leprosula]